MFYFGHLTFFTVNMYAQIKNKLLFIEKISYLTERIQLDLKVKIDI